MPFDFSEHYRTTDLPVYVEQLCQAALGKGSLKDRRAAAVLAFEVASNAVFNDEEGADHIDLLEIAEALASVVPKPREPVEAPSNSGEWAEYTPAQRRGRGSNFHPGRVASFRFADGEIIRVNLSHKATLDQPDWAKATRVAVMFYKARRSRNFLRLVGDKPGCTQLTHAEEYADTCLVPEIVEGIDETRGTKVDVAMANAHTSDRREGPAYLSELVDIAADLGGDWGGAWRAARAATYRALDRQKLKRERVMDAAILAS